MNEPTTADICGAIKYRLSNTQGGQEDTIAEVSISGNTLSALTTTRKEITVHVHAYYQNFFAYYASNPLNVKIQSICQSENFVNDFNHKHIYVQKNKKINGSTIQEIASETWMKTLWPTPSNPLGAIKRWWMT